MENDLKIKIKEFEKEAIENNELTNSEDNELFNHHNALSQLIKKTETLSIRLSSKDKWSLELLKRIYFKDEAFKTSTGAAIERLIKEGVLGEIPFINKKPKDQDYSLTKIFFRYFLDSPDLAINFDYSSVVDLTFSWFYIFRVIKLFYVDEKLLSKTDKELVKFIEETPELWLNENINFESGYLRPKALIAAFSDKNNSNPEKFKFKEMSETFEVNVELFESNWRKERKDMACPYVPNERDDDEFIKNPLKIKKFSTSDPNNISSYDELAQELAIKDFTLEIERLRSLKKKQQPFSKVKKYLNELNLRPEV